jgi:hypothetical protein
MSHDALAPVGQAFIIKLGDEARRLGLERDRQHPGW